MSSISRALENRKLEIKTRLHKAPESPRSQEIREKNERHHSHNLMMSAKARHLRRHGHSGRTSLADRLHSMKEMSRERR